MSALKRELADREAAFATAQATSRNLTAQRAEAQAALAGVLEALERTAADQGLVEPVRHTAFLRTIASTGRNGARNETCRQAALARQQETVKAHMDALALKERQDRETARLEQAVALRRRPWRNS
ncbi:MAG: hypothetical protein ACLR7Z_06690 [Bilophila wadsworthia]